MTPEAAALLAGNLAVVVALAAVGGWTMYSRFRHMPPSAYAEMEQTLADMNRQMSDLRAQQAADHATIRELRREVNRLDEELRLRDMAWRVSYAELVLEFGKATGRAPESRPLGDAAPALVAAPVASPVSDATLLRLVCEVFDRDEIDGLAFEMSLGRNLSGDTLEERARSLISVAKRRGRLPELIELCRRDRPNGGF